jgi:flagellar protein FliS
MSVPDQYLKTQVMTASPYDLHLMVVNGAIRYAKHAEKSLEARSYEIAHLSLTKSREFVAEMMSGLRPEHAPEAVANLKSLFNFVHANLVRADMERNPQLVQDAVRILELHRETWTELGRQLAAAEKAETPRTESSPVPPPHAAMAKPRLSRVI